MPLWQNAVLRPEAPHLLMSPEVHLLPQHLRSVWKASFAPSPSRDRTPGADGQAEESPGWAGGERRRRRRDSGESQSGFHTVMGHEDEGLRHLFRSGGALFHPGYLFVVDSRVWTRCVRCPLHLGERLRSGQHNVPDGSIAAAEDDVRERASDSDRHHAGVSDTDAVCRVLVEKQWTCSFVLRPAIPRFYLVWSLLHSLRQRCCRKDVLAVHLSPASSESPPIRSGQCGSWTVKSSQLISPCVSAVSPSLSGYLRPWGHL